MVCAANRSRRRSEDGRKPNLGYARTTRSTRPMVERKIRFTPCRREFDVGLVHSYQAPEAHHKLAQPVRAGCVAIQIPSAVGATRTAFPGHVLEFLIPNRFLFGTNHENHPRR